MFIRWRAYQVIKRIPPEDRDLYRRKLLAWELLGMTHRNKIIHLNDQKLSQLSLLLRVLPIQAHTTSQDCLVGINFTANLSDKNSKLIIDCIYILYTCRRPEKKLGTRSSVVW